jgi:hypothetical protein
MSEVEPIQVEESGQTLSETDDKRRKLPAPLEVRLVAISDVSLPYAAGSEPKMDQLYVKQIGLERVKETPRLAYRADNCCIMFSPHEGLIHRDQCRPLRIEIPALSEMEKKLAERQVGYEKQRGLTPGTECLVVYDPSGNCLEIVESRKLF